MHYTRLTAVIFVALFVVTAGVLAGCSEPTATPEPPPGELAPTAGGEMPGDITGEYPPPEEYIPPPGPGEEGYPPPPTETPDYGYPQPGEEPDEADTDAAGESGAQDTDEAGEESSEDTGEEKTSGGG